MKLYCFKLCTVICSILICVIYSILSYLKFTKVTPSIVFRDLREKNNLSELMVLKYILLWTPGDKDNTIPFAYMGEGQKCFVTKRCTYVNCFVTREKSLLGSHSKFDVIVFPGPQLEAMVINNYAFPNSRSVHQKYVFANIESPANYGIYSKMFDEYFNWTWTYKLNSDVRWGYIVVRDLENNIIGPKADMNWLKLEEMDPVPESFKQKMKTKKKAAAWFASNCISASKRERFVLALRHELLKYKLLLDVYGKCGIYTCDRNNEEVCDKKVAEKYYFYLAFENAFSEDYVTEKLLRALKNDAVPIVYGGANYTRFMPDGIYLNALDLGVNKLAAKMDELIKDPDKYANYFRWKNHYKYEKTTDHEDTDEYCKMCAILNDDEAVKKVTVYRDFRGWWNGKEFNT